MAGSTSLEASIKTEWKFQTTWNDSSLSYVCQTYYHQLKYFGVWSHSTDYTVIGVYIRDVAHFHTQWCARVGSVTRLDGARGKKRNKFHVPMFETEVIRKLMYCSEESTSGIV